jgi:hypothetical protein
VTRQPQPESDFRESSSSSSPLDGAVVVGVHTPSSIAQRKSVGHFVVTEHGGTQVPGGEFVFE